MVGTPGVDNVLLVRAEEAPKASVFMLYSSTPSCHKLALTHGYATAHRPDFPQSR
jgi:hypothetical protein